MKQRHQRLVEFLNIDGDFDENDMNIEIFVNTKLENLEKLKFDDKKWEIDPKYFLIDGMLLFFLIYAIQCNSNS